MPIPEEQDAYACLYRGPSLHTNVLVSMGMLEREGPLAQFGAVMLWPWAKGHGAHLAAVHGSNICKECQREGVVQLQFGLPGEVKFE